MSNKNLVLYYPVMGKWQGRYVLTPKAAWEEVINKLGEVVRPIIFKDGKTPYILFFNNHHIEIKKYEVDMDDVRAYYREDMVVSRI